MNNAVEYLIRLRDEFSAKMQAAAGVGAKGGATIAQGMAVAVAAGLKFKTEINAGWDVLNGNYEALGTVLGALPGPLGEIGEIAGSALGKMIKDTEEAAEGYRKLSAATGSSVEFLSGFKEAADDVRVSGESVDSALTKFARGLGGVKDASDGVAENGKGVAASLADIGVKANDAEGHVRPLADILPDVADAFSKMADGPAKTALAIQLFGKQGAELIPILNKGRDGLKEMMQAAEAAGLTMSGKTVEAVDKLKQAQDALGDSVTAFGRKVGTAAIPALAAFIDKINFLIGVQGTYQQKTSDVTAALVEFNKTHTLSAETVAKLKAGGADTVNILKSMAESTASESAGMGVLAGVATNAAQELQKVHPELFQVSENADKATQSTEELTAAQKKVTEGSAEYRDKTVQLTDAMLKRDEQLDSINQKEKDLAEAYKNGYITSDQYSQGQLHLMDATAKVKDEFDKAAGKIHDGAAATEAMDKAAQGAAERERDYEKATRDAAKATEDLKEKTDNLTDGFGKMPEKMDAAAKAAMAWKLATGQMTIADAEQTLVAQGLTAAFVKHKITLKEMRDIGIAYRNGEITGEQALKQAGAWKDAAFIGVAKDYREVEAASGAAGRSELTHADYIKLVTTVRKTQKASMDDVIDAQLYLNKVTEADSKTMKDAKADLDAKKISERDYLAVQMNVAAEHDKVAASAREVEKAYNGGKAATQSSIHIVDTYGAHLEDVGLKLDQYGNIVKGIPESKTVEVKTEIDHPEVTNEAIRKLMNLPPLPVTADTSGFTEPVKGAKADAEKPVTVPVDFKSATLPTFGTGTGGSATPSVTLPVSFDTSGVQAALDKLPTTRGISLALDTVSFDQNLLRVNAAMAGKVVDIKADASTVPGVIDEAQKKIDSLTGKTVSVAIASSGSLSLPTASSITVSVVGDTADASKKIKEVIDTVIPEKTAFINGDSLGAMTILDAVNDAKVDEKTLIIEGAHKSALGADAGASGKTFAMDAISEVNAAVVPLKTMVIAGNNTHAMGAIASVKTAMESLKDKTIYVNVVRNDIPVGGSSSGNSGSGDSNGGGNRPASNVREGGVVVNQTFYVGSELDLALVERKIKQTFAELVSR